MRPFSSAYKCQTGGGSAASSNTALWSVALLRLALLRLVHRRSALRRVPLVRQGGMIVTHALRTTLWGRSQMSSASKVRMDRLGSAFLALSTFLSLSLGQDAGAQPLKANPSAAPSEIANPSSINPAAAASDIGNPSAINPAAAASQLPRPPQSNVIVPSRSGGVTLPIAPQRIVPLPRSPAVQRTPRGSGAAKQVERRQERPSPGWAKRMSVNSWKELREHLATCWTVPAGTMGSSVMLRFMISSVGELRGPPMITSTNVIPKELSGTYRDAASAVLDRCLPISPTADFGAILHDTILHLRLVNSAPFPSRNLGPWMAIFAQPPNTR